MKTNHRRNFKERYRTPTKHYYTLLVREEGTWTPEFGDYNSNTVRSEFRDYRDHDIRAKDLKIICTGDDHDEIMSYVAKLNKELH